jgi:hypothetical protein
MNWDDDDMVEKYKSKIAEGVNKRAWEAEHKRNLGRDISQIEKEVCSNVVNVVQNIEYGDCPVAMKRAYVSVQCPHPSTELGEQKAVVVMCLHDGFQAETTDMKMLTKLCSDEDMCDMTEELAAQEKPGISVAKAVQNLVEIAGRKGQINSVDVPRLKTLYATWMKGVTWKKCYMTPTNRPSLGSWNGWPWDSYNIIDRSLNRNLVGKNVIVGFSQGRSIADVIEPESLPLFKLVWKAEANIKNVAEITHDAISAALDHEKNQHPLKKQKR